MGVELRSASILKTWGLGFRFFFVEFHLLMLEKHSPYLTCRSSQCFLGACNPASSSVRYRITGASRLKGPIL